MTDSERYNRDKVISMTQFEFQLELDKVRLEQRAKDKELIDDLIRELYTSRAYHLGITGLDSKEEIICKEKEGDCALIRGIDRTIKYVKEAIGE